MTQRDPAMWGVWLPGDEVIRFNDFEVFDLGNPKKLVRYGHVWVHDAFSMRVRRAGTPPLSMRIGLVNGRFRCLELAEVEGDPFLDEKALAAIPLRELIREGVGAVSYFVFDIEDEEDVRFVRAQYQTFIDLDEHPIRLEDIQIGDKFRVAAHFVYLVGRDAFEKYLKPEAARNHDHEQRQRPSVSDQTFVDAWLLALAAGDDVTLVLGEKFRMEPGSIRNRASRLRTKGFDLPARKGPKPNSITTGTDD